MNDILDTSEQLLNIYNIDLLKESLINKYQDRIVIKDYIDKVNNKLFYIILNNDNIYNFIDLKVSNADYDNIIEFNNTLLNYNYYVSSYCKNNDKWCIFIDKIYSNNVSREIYDNNYSLYYFTDKQTQKEILNSELICNNRIYLFVTNKKLTDQSIHSNIFKFIYKYCNLQKLIENGIGIIKVSYDGQIFTDNTYNNDYTVFICHSIIQENENLKEIRNKDITINNLINFNKGLQFHKRNKKH